MNKLFKNMKHNFLWYWNWGIKGKVLLLTAAIIDTALVVLAVRWFMS